MQHRLRRHFRRMSPRRSMLLRSRGSFSPHTRRLRSNHSIQAVAEAALAVEAARVVEAQVEAAVKLAAEDPLAGTVAQGRPAQAAKQVAPGQRGTRAPREERAPAAAPLPRTTTPTTT